MQSDKYILIESLFTDLVSGQKNIGDSVHMLDELIEAKQFFSDFYGEDSSEYQISKALFGLLNSISRSIRFQKECKKQHLSDWIVKIPSRTDQLNRLRNLIESV